MSFTSLHFLVFLPAVFLLYWLVPARWRNPLLLIASYYFYMSWNPWFGILLAGTTVIDWLLAIQIEKSLSTGNSKFKIQNSKFYLALSVISNIGCLAAFKYSAFAYNTFSWSLSQFSGNHPHYIAALIIPVGLSFYVFHSLSYTIDVYRGKIQAEKNLLNFALFVSFFPQLVAGPIARFNQLGVQFRETKFLRSEMLLTGMRLVLWGYFKKIAIADRLADIVNPVFDAPENFSGLTLLFAGFCFVVQVYCDFSGYSDIATGIARFFGYELQINWRRPLLSSSLHEFWSRNHISMTSWFRDYFYISIGGSRVKYPRWLLNLFLTFLISGLWHGASWTFVAWGAMHGIAYIIETLLFNRTSQIVHHKSYITNRKSYIQNRKSYIQNRKSYIQNRKSHIPNRKFPFAGWLYLISFHTITLIAFRAANFHDLGVFYSKIFSFHWSISQSLQEIRTITGYFPAFLGICGIFLLFAKELHEEKGWLIRMPSFGKWLRPVFYVFLFLLLFTAGQFSTNEFIYFHF